ncbi:uncharacterized protein B0H18DRAFT_1121922 [Fomitopsis serialis]|uniref:uncharacterized protein n=1 Tax=Fomitopsis serialis TaxID=139415 RepID=UPI0020088782|nr:uncharacterized protein B0H18DRAFT_1121922 [Neoantrodia serialis]KAH9920460.1 hypothetical protein B0H18DRAFT_1121922 [Neoantrodia serialis]
MQGIQPEDPGRFLSDARHPFSHESYYPTIDHSDTRSPVPEHLALHSFPSPTHTPNYHQYLPWPGAYSAAVNDSEGQAFQDISIPTDSTYGHGNLDQQPHERRGMTVDAASGSPVPEDHLIAGATGGVRFSQVSTNRTIYEYHEPFNVKAESDHHGQSTSLPAIADGITTRDRFVDLRRLPRYDSLLTASDDMWTGSLELLELTASLERRVIPNRPGPR